MVPIEDNPQSDESIPIKLLQLATQQYNHGQFHAALATLEQLDHQESITEFEQLQGQLLRCRIVAYQNVLKAQELAEQILQRSQALNQPLIQVDAILIIAEAWLESGQLETSKKWITQAKTVLNSLPNHIGPEGTPKEAWVRALEGGLSAYQEYTPRTLELLQESLNLREQLDLPREIAQSLYYLGIAYTHHGEYDRALTTLQHSLRQYQQLQFAPGIAKVLLHLGRTYTNQGDLGQALNAIQKSKALCEQLGMLHDYIYTYAWSSYIHFARCDLTQALELLQYSLPICAQLGIPGTFAEAKLLQRFGQVYRRIGDVEPALKYLQQSLTMFKAQGFLAEISLTLGMLGDVYKLKGELDIALDYHLNAMKIIEDSGNAGYIILCLMNVILVTLEQDQKEQAQKYWQRIQKLLPIRKEKGGRLGDDAITLIHGLILKTSPRLRDKLHAQEIFQQLVDKESILSAFQWRPYLELCDSLLYEFKITENPDLLQEIQALTDHILDVTNEQNDYDTLAQTYVLQAKLALLDLNLPRAQHLLTQAQGIADDKGLHHLAQRISQEHDMLLTQIPEWEVLQTQDASLAKIREMAGVEAQLTGMTYPRALDPPALQPETPVLFLIMLEGGLTLFSYSFAGAQHMDEHLIGGFLTALTAFGQDALVESGAIDRISYQNYTVAVKPLETLLCCYIFQGPSYGALQKLDQFLTRVQEMPPLHYALTTEFPSEKASKARPALAPEHTSELQHLIAEIF